jgi:DNA-directed DNA polymerase III PolC
VQPIFCLEAKQTPLLKMMAAIDHNCLIAEVQPEHLPALGDITTAVYWPSPEDLLQAYRAHPAFLENVGAIVQRCQPSLPEGQTIWPVPLLAAQQTAETAIIAHARRGLRERYGNKPAALATRRLKEELEAIVKAGFAPFFLVVADIVDFARQQDILVNTRGSVANSLVAYCLGITNVDPIAHDLLFERFLNPARRNPPDIDLDFCSRRRDEVLEYVRRRYGEERVALVATVSTMQPRSAVREVGKAHGLDEETIQTLGRVIPANWHPDPRRRRTTTLDEALSVLTDPIQRQVVETAYHLIGQPHHLSLHPGGIVITPGPLTDLLPVQLSPKGFLATQYEFNDLEAIGLPKIDLLGIRALTVLADTADLVRRFQVDSFDLTAIPDNDRRTGAIMARGETIGVFQCESEGAQRTLRQLRARTIADLAVAGAFFKPGPATGGMARAFVRRYRGDERVDYLHPALEPILSSTKGVLLFQEQVLRIAREIAGLSWAEADRLRHGMSKFKAGEMEALSTRFAAGCLLPAPEGPGLSAEQIKTLWKQIMAFAGYGFNRGHATAYADVSYRSAFIKANWPAEFLAARLANAGGFHHPAIYMAEAQRLGVAVRPPHINRSLPHFTLTYEPEDGEGSGGSLQPTLWMGLGQVRDLRRASIQALLTERAQRPFNSLRDLLARVSLQPKELNHLIQCGALDGLGDSRAALLEEANVVVRAGSVQQLAFAFAAPVVKQAESATQRMRWEWDILGQPVSVHPLSLVELPARAVPLQRLPASNGRLLTVCGVRLPGWTGSSGFFLSDGETFVIAKVAADAANHLPRRSLWQPLRLRGRWTQDEWDGGWLHVQEIEHLPVENSVRN